MGKVCLVLSSSLDFSPYANNYLELINPDNVDIIQWNRLKIKNTTTTDNNICSRLMTFEDSHSGHQKGFFQYLKYIRYIKKILKEYNYEKIIVFGIQLSFLLGRSLKHKDYIIDIRDYHFLSKAIKTKKILKQSRAIVLSSNGYKAFIPNHENILINHNFNIKNVYPDISVNNLQRKKDAVITISSIGANRDLSESIRLIDQLKNHDTIKLNFHGKSEVNSILNKYIINNNITNVEVTGFYEKYYEYKYYEKSDLINSFRDNRIYNNRVALPNKLYNSLYYNKPIITNEGSYLAELISTYNLGFVTNIHEKIGQQIIQYLDEFNHDEFIKGKMKFLNIVKVENSQFQKFISDEFGN